jgi:hypothetical protein
MRRSSLLGKWPTIAAIVAIGIAGCGGGSSNPATPTVRASIAIPNSTTPAFSFDISYADSGKYYLADRNNAAVDVVDTHSNTLIGQIKGGFTGNGASPETSGPDGLVGIPGTNILYAGDVNNIKVIDTSAQQVVGTIPISTSGNRVDEGCYDPDDNIVMFASPADTPPFVTFIANGTRTVLTKLTFPTSSGLEACVYDPNTKRFLINNDGTPANPNGEVDAITAASVVAAAPTVSAAYPLGNCAPTGLALGPGNDMLVGCDPDAGVPLQSLILDRTTGSTIATIPFGGVDQIAYDPKSNRYFMPARHETANGIAASSGFTPLLGVVDASQRKLIAQVPVGTGVHSVAIDNATDQVYLPYSPGSPNFLNGGILVLNAI